MYTWIKIEKTEDFDQLVDTIGQEYNPKKVANTIKSDISAAVRRVLIEHNYADKDYRSTYYNFYSKKGRRYRSSCVRLHFFHEDVEFDARLYQLSDVDKPFSQNSHVDERFGELYFGYMVLRPTGIGTIGRTVLSPDIRNNARGLTIWADHKVHLLGYKMNVRGFPSMDQHNDISVCAHAACWSILRHYSECYTTHREFLVHDITLMAQHHDPGGLLPSLGLELSHAEGVFQEAGTYPIRVARKGKSAKNDPEFYRQLTAYIESGIPVFAADHGRFHAFAVVGCNRQSPSAKPPKNERHSWDELQSMIVIDDHYLPYQSISANGSKRKSPYDVEDIDAFIVPLPEKMHYPADAIDILASSLRRLPPMIALPEEKDTVVRYFITTGSAYRRFVRDHLSEFDPELVKIAMTLPFAQFLWIVEYATSNEWAESHITARAIIDATASVHEPMPLWLFHGRDRALVFNRRVADLSAGGLKQLALKGMQDTALSRMDQNLRTIESK